MSATTVAHTKSSPTHWNAPGIPAVASLFPQLEIVELIGQGGMGCVFKARQPQLDRFVALKLLPQELASDSFFTDRFSREGRVLAKLNHPNIVTIYDFGTAGGLYYLLMEYVAGENLRQALKGGRLPPTRALAIVPEICEALQYAHEQGVLHRDIKPENILLKSDGHVKIADFGIAKLALDDRKSGTLTGAGAILGTPHYMAPEQLENPAEVDHRADIYSLGVVFYEILTGELPIGRFAPPSARTPVDPRLDAIVLQALQKQRDLRYSTAREMRARIQDVASSKRNRSGDVAGQSKPRGTAVVQAGRTWFTGHTSKQKVRWAAASVGVALLATVVALAFSHLAREPKVSVETSAADGQRELREQERREEAIALARARLEETVRGFAAGQISTGEVVKAQRDLAFTEAGSDAGKFARANLQYFEWVLAEAQKTGTPEEIWTAELDLAKAHHAVAVADAKGDKVKLARADLVYATTALAIRRQQSAAGMITLERLRAAERDLTRAEAYLNALLAR